MKVDFNAPSESRMLKTLCQLLFYHVLFAILQGLDSCDLGGGFRGGGQQAWATPIFTCKNFLEPYICPYANTCLKISACIDLKCLLYVSATIKIQFGNTILSHTHPPLGRYASSHVRAPLFKNSGSSPGSKLDSLITFLI